MINLNFEYNYKMNPNYEIVERKGQGHPDTLCDAIAERCSYEYCKYFNLKFGRYADHWFDKVILVGGRSDISYGVGNIIEPYKVLICGKCVKRVGQVEIPVYQIFQKAVDYVLSNNLTGYSSKEHRVVIDYTVDSQGAGRLSNRYQPRSISDLKEISSNDKVSNDCNILSAHYPFSLLEQSIIDLEKHLNSSTFKKTFPFSGWDIKITGIGSDGKLEYVVNVPIIAHYVKNKDDYLNKIRNIEKMVNDFLLNKLGNVEFIVIINPQDKTGEPYLTALGSAADTGDVGVVGRGNRANGLITPMKSMSIEAASGKNPLDHTGKIYTLLAQRISKKIFSLIGKANQVHITTYKELPLVTPQNIIVEFEEAIKREDKEIMQHMIETEFSENNIERVIQQLCSNYNCFW